MIVNSPRIPYIGRIGSQCQPGMVITIDGRPAPRVRRFAINLEAGTSNPSSGNQTNDVALHLNPRFDDQYVVRNSRVNGIWQNEEWAPRRLPLSRDATFTIMILIQESGFKIAVNNVHFVDFNHRIPLSVVQLLHIYGDVIISRINILSPQMQHQITNFPTVVSTVPGFVQSNPYSPAIGAPLMPQPMPMMSSSVGIPVQQPPASAPVLHGFGYSNSSTGADTTVINNPSLPLMHRILTGMRPGMKVKMIGKPSFGFDRFDIELVKGGTNEIALQVNPRNRERCVIRNSCIRGNWGQEERTGHQFPFMYGSIFSLTIRVEHNRFNILINDQYFCDFHHRIQPLNQIDLIRIKGDVQVNSVHINQD